MAKLLCCHNSNSNSTCFTSLLQRLWKSSKAMRYKKSQCKHIIWYRVIIWSKSIASTTEIPNTLGNGWVIARSFRSDAHAQALAWEKETVCVCVESFCGFLLTATVAVWFLWLQFRAKQFKLCLLFYENYRAISRPLCYVTDTKSTFNWNIEKFSK